MFVFVCMCVCVCVCVCVHVCVYFHLYLRFIMEEVDLVIVGAEGVAESGGVINKV